MRRHDLASEVDVGIAHLCPGCAHQEPAGPARWSGASRLCRRQPRPTCCRLCAPGVAPPPAGYRRPCLPAVRFAASGAAGQRDSIFKPGDPARQRYRVPRDQSRCVRAEDIPTIIDCAIEARNFHPAGRLNCKNQPTAGLGNQKALRIGSCLSPGVTIGGKGWHRLTALDNCLLIPRSSLDVAFQ